MNQPTTGFKLPVVKGHDPKRQDHVEAALAKLGTADEHRARALGDAIRYCRKERATILGTAADDLAAYRRKMQESKRAYGVWSPQQAQARRLEQLRHAQSLDVNVDALFHLNEYARQAFQLLVNAGVDEPVKPLCHQGFGHTGTPAQGGNVYKPPLTLPEQTNCSTFIPPYPGTGAFVGAHLEGESVLKASDSFFNAATATVGGFVRIEDWDADNYDASWVHQENGFVAVFHTKKIGLVQVTATFQCVEHSYHIDTQNEFGISDSQIESRSIARLAAFHVGDSDPQAGSAVLDGIGYSGDGDYYPSPQWFGYGPGMMVATSRIPNIVFPANTDILVYAAARQEVSFWVNDVSVDTWSKGKWLLKSIEVCHV